MPLDLSVIITSYNSSSTLSDTIESLLRLNPDETPKEIIVVDNASSDGSADIAQSFPELQVLRSTVNQGLATANNRGAEISTGRSLLFLNPDTEILPGALNTLMKFEETHPDAGLLGPAMLDSTDTVLSTARTFPTLIDIMLRRTLLGKLPGTQAQQRKHLFSAEMNNPSRTDWLVGAALWLTGSGRKEFGLMSPKYFLYFEDVEWCFRAHKAGMEVWFVPDAVIKHACRRESAGKPGKALWFHLRSMVRFFIEHPSVAIGKHKASWNKKDRLI
ncbi:MAG: glycosyltransferase family 2 protein [Candidatus Aegiribacteria sp.]|nr:glycosyltransferase family 2 protein [Candidatus Aegiribacteria sp.]